MSKKSSSEESTEQLTFSQLALSEPVLRAIQSVGYESPSPIQAQTIPLLLQGRDVLGQAQTGTGKTAAFALPILSNIDMEQTKPQALVLAPTRELAIQVAEAFQTYAAHLRGFHVLPIYGGQSYGPQLAGLRRGVHVVVGTPGRVIDHIEKGTLKLDQLKCLVLDEADEMLRMGFIDDVEKVLKVTPKTRQIALFSATMPAQIRRIAQTYLNNPEEVTIKSKTSTATNIRQRYWMVSGMHKLDALTRILEVEPFDGMLVFARTKRATEELAEKLEARGFAAAALNGDIAQAQRERTVQKLKDGSLDIIVATDVAARGLDVERISHVFNYDIPYDTESYVHRIGRTGRAGRSGDAILFISPRERNMLRTIERATKQEITQMELPTIKVVNDQRIAKFKTRITETIAAGELSMYRNAVEQYEQESNVPAIEIAAALASMVYEDKPLLVSATRSAKEAYPPDSRDGREPRRGDRAPRDDKYERPSRFERSDKPERPSRDSRSDRPDRAPRFERDSSSRPDRAPRFERDSAPRPERAVRPDRDSGERAPRFEQASEERIPLLDRASESRGERSPRAERDNSDRDSRPSRDSDRRDFEPRDRAPRGKPEAGMQTYRIEVGHVHGVKPGNIVGAVANEAGLDSKFIGRIEIMDEHSLLDMPEGMPKEILQHLKKVWVSGQQLKMAVHSESGRSGSKGPKSSHDSDAPQRRPAKLGPPRERAGEDAPRRGPPSDKKRFKRDS